MLEELFNLHQDLIATIDRAHKRFLYDQISWDSQALCIHGARGVGKTTLLCQYFLDHYKTIEKALYISADNIHVLNHGLLTVASRYFNLGGEAIFIDEVHKYPNWSIEIKNIIDTFRKKQIIFSGSSAMELKQSKADLSRRVVYYELPNLSFREYLYFTDIKKVSPIVLSKLISEHTKIADHFKEVSVLKHFNDYLRYGCYPYFLESRETYLLKLNNVIEKIIIEDIAQTKNIKAKTIIVLKKLLWLVATSTCLVPNIDKISKNLSVTREVVYNCIKYLEQAGLIQSIYPHAKGMKLIRKPGKIFMSNSNLLHAVNGSLSLEGDVGSIRETFFANQLAFSHAIHTHDTMDFMIDNKYLFEVGGKGKNAKQIQGAQNAFMAIDGIQIGMGKRIPLYLFGCLY